MIGVLIDKLFDRLKTHGSKVAIFEKGNTYTYSNLLAEAEKWTSKFEKILENHQVIALQSDFSFEAIALLIALYQQGKVVALISPSAKNVPAYCEDAQAGYLFHYTDGRLGGSELIKRDKRVNKNTHPLLVGLATKKHAGFIIFSSGTTGRPKAILHDLENFLTSYDNVKKAFCTLSFLLLDHIAGLDTLFYTLSSGGSLALPTGRTPTAVCKLISDCKVEVLPVSPSFLNLLLLSGEYQNFDLSSLKIVSYGSEPINNSVLAQLPELFPNAKIIQKYGTSEFGSPRSKTKEGDSAWMKLDGEQFQTKIEKGVLWVKAQSTMLGYLNAEGMLEQDGWLCTGDLVEVDGPWMRIVGRQSDIINVGGEKVFPIEVESIINGINEVMDCIVFGEQHAILGNQVCVKVRCDSNVETKQLRKLIRKHCTHQLERFKVPSKFEFVSEELTNQRQKKIRSIQ